jgi:hypothetical protein
MTDGGAEILFYTSHSVAISHGPYFSLECENAVIETSREDASELVARFADGTVASYGRLAHGDTKLWQCVDAVRTGAPVACPLLAALSQTAAVLLAHESCPQITEFPVALRESSAQDGSTVLWVRGLSEAMQEGYARGVLPSEIGGLDWARPGAVIDTSGCLQAV